MFLRIFAHVVILIVRTAKIQLGGETVRRNPYFFLKILVGQ